VLRIVPEIEVLVGPAVAVVVLPVAALHAPVALRAGGLAAGQGVVVLVVPARIAAADPALAAPTDRLRMTQAAAVAALAAVGRITDEVVAVVDEAVAVVVLTVADLDAAVGEGAAALAAVVLPAVEVRVAGGAAGEVAEGVPAAPRAVAVLAAVVARATVLGVARQQEVLVGVAVAIVVEPVAALGDRPAAIGPQPQVLRPGVLRPGVDAGIRGRLGTGVSLPRRRGARDQHSEQQQPAGPSP